MSEIVLKQCPFCGGRADYYTKSITGMLGETFGINCTCCGAGTAGNYSTKEDAAKVWNRRYEPPTPGGALVPAGNARLKRSQ